MNTIATLLGHSIKICGLLIILVCMTADPTLAQNDNYWMLVDAKSDLLLGNYLKMQRMDNSLSETSVYKELILKGLGCPSQDHARFANQNAEPTKEPIQSAGSNKSTKKMPSLAEHPLPCNIHSLYIDLAADGSPPGRALAQAIKKALATDGRILLVANRSEAQALFSYHFSVRRSTPKESLGDTESDNRDLAIVSVDTKFMDADGDYPSISWKVIVENKTPHELRLMGKIEYLDSDGYVLDTDLFSGYISGEEQETFRGQTPVSHDELANVSDTKAVIVDYFRPEH